MNPRQCGGRPCIRGMRACVLDVLDLYATGLLPEEILAEMPDLELLDLVAAVRYDSGGAEQVSWPATEGA